MNILGIIFALLAGVFFGIIGPLQKLHIIWCWRRSCYFFALYNSFIIVSPLIPNQAKLITIYKNHFGYFF